MTQLIFMSIFLLSGLHVSAQSANDDLKKQAHLDGVEINGLVVDETITKVGRDFYELFYQYWEAPKSPFSYSIFVKEQPMNGLGSKILLLVNETEIFSQTLQPRHDIIEGAAKYAVALSRRYVLNYEQLMQQLESEDQQGSGIY